jgi:predicted TIM-barrel fold metal-dependent hydrolase
MPNQTKLVQRFRQQAGLTSPPADLAGYLSFVTRVLEDHRRRGAVAAKFEIAYFRSFVFDDPPRDSVEAIYAKYRQGGTPGAAEYKAFQDFVFRYVLTECGRLHLPVHIHSAAGAGDYFSLAGTSVLNLEPVLRDPRYLSTTFVLIHGGYPFDQQAMLIAMMKNVWLDSSATGSFLMYPNQFKDVLKRWFEIMPGKVTFGSDAFPIDEHIGAEELYWFGVHNARTAAAAALAEMVAAREITESHAMTIARGYLHDNAAGLYK